VFDVVLRRGERIVSVLAAIVSAFVYFFGVRIRHSLLPTQECTF